HPYTAYNYTLSLHDALPILERKMDSTVVSLNTENAAFGSRTLSAKLYYNGEERVAYSNIVVVPPTPKRYGFNVVAEYPHDPEARSEEHTSELQSRENLVCRL